MDTKLLSTEFTHICARLKVAELPQFRGPVRLNIARDRDGE
jgi:hypothetical protein